MKPSLRSGLIALWLFTGALIAIGVYATRSAVHAAQQQQPDSAAVMSPAQQQAIDSAPLPPSGPPAAGVGGGAAVDTAGAVVQGRSIRVGDYDTSLSQRLVSLLGIFTLLLIAWLLSVNRSLIPWRIVLWGLGLQLTFALLILKTPVGAAFFTGINDAIVALLDFTKEGARFLFGNLVMNNVPVGTGEPGDGPFTPTVGNVANTGALFAFSVLPTIVFFSSLMTVFYHLGVMQLVVKGAAWVMMRTMKTSGAE